ncbi:MAG: DUF6036 family nucleotidyltransferase [Anaerolineales bacterium]
MSQRPPVDRQRIIKFLQALGRRFRKPGRVYLVGGTTMVYEGFRAQTLDIDLAFSIEDRDHADSVRTIQRLKTELAINVEEASPGDFIPLPPGYQTRAHFIGRFGQLDVFHFDLYSVALSKIERGRDADFADVLALLEAERIDIETLRSHFKYILPRLSGFSLKADPQEFQLKFGYLEGRWGDSP